MANRKVIIGSKVCIRCKQRKGVSEYYAHKQMGDGRLNKCKACCKAQAKIRHHKLMKNPEFHEAEQARGREKYKRLNYKEKFAYLKDKYPWKNNYVYKNLRRDLSKNVGLPKDIELHHWCYVEEKLRDVFVLDKFTHRRLHQLIEVNIEERIFYTNSGDKLDSREKHKEFILINFPKLKECNNWLDWESKVA